MVTKEKGLELDRRPKKNMYIEDVTEFAHILLTTTEMTFDYSWQHIQFLFFCQLTAITANHPGALLNLCYQGIVLTLIQAPEGGHPQLFIFLKLDFTPKASSFEVIEGPCGDHSTSSQAHKQQKKAQKGIQWFLLYEKVVTGQIGVSVLLIVYSASLMTLGKTVLYWWSYPFY